MSAPTEEYDPGVGIYTERKDGVVTVRLETEPGDPTPLVVEINDAKATADVQALLGKTVQAVSTRTMTGRDLHYKDDVTWTEHTLTFTDGTTFVVDESHQELDGTTIREYRESE